MPCAALYALEVPPFGGDTIFANQYHAYDRLSPTYRAVLDQLSAVHSGSATARLVGQEPDSAPEAVVHPVVRVHPWTGRRALFLSRAFVRGIDGMSRAESESLLEHLFEASHAEAITFRHKWERGDLVLCAPLRHC